MTLDVCAVIPARLDSFRYPGKVLADVDGHPVLWHVWQRVQQATRIADVSVATDAPEVRAAAEGWGARVLMTDSSPHSGTERIAVVLEHLEGELIVNIPADEPLIEPALVDQLVQDWVADPCDLITPVYPIREPAKLWDPTVVKVVRTHSGDALYFSRSAIPAVRDSPMFVWPQAHHFWGHIGVYGYSRETLRRYQELPPSALETAEGLEQLRFLEAGCRIRTFETDHRSVAVNAPSDLNLVKDILRRS